MKINMMRLGSEVSGRKGREGWMIGNDNLYVKEVYPHVTFTTNVEDAHLCMTKVEAETIQEYVESHFDF